MPRNPDGSFRAANKPLKVSARWIISRWLEQEVYKQRLLGVSLRVIAETIPRSVRGEVNPAVPLPPGIEFPPDFKITQRSIERIWARILKGFSGGKVEEARVENNLRTDIVWLSMQKGLLQGDPESGHVALRTLEHQARMNGLNAPTGVRVDGKLKVEHDDDGSEEPEESREFQLAVLRAMTDRERRIIEKIMERARVRARDVMASEKAKPATAIEVLRIEDTSDEDQGD